MPVPIICKSKGITASSLFCPAMKRKHTGMFFTLYTAQKLLTVLYLFMFHLSRSFSNQDLVLDALWQERGSPCQHPADAAPLQVLVPDLPSV